MTRTTPAAAARAAMPERYGRPRRAATVVVVAASVVLAAAGLGWLVWAASSRATPDVAGGVTAYDVVSASRTDVSLEVERRVAAAVTCDVYAQAEDRTIVGERSVTWPAAAPGTVRTTIAIVTERRATTAGVSGCRVAGP